MAGELEAPGAEKSLARRATEKAIGGWWEAAGDQAITKVAGWLIGPALGVAVTAWLRENGVALLNAVCVGAMASVPLVVLFVVARHVARLKRDLAAVKDSLAGGTPSPALTTAASPSRPPIFSRQTSPLTIAAIGIFRQATLEYIKPGSVAKFRCTCAVDFYGVMPGNCSPAELRLTTKAGQRELAILKAENVSRLPGAMFYEGTGDWLELMRVGMDSDRRSWKGTSPWDEFPPSNALYFEVEFRPPGGDARQRHEQSLVRLDCEFGQGFRPARLKIDPWNQLQSPSVTLTLL